MPAEIDSPLGSIIFLASDEDSGSGAEMMPLALAEANAFFKSMQNAAIREPVTKTSADIPLVLRELLDKTPVGHLTPPEVTKQGVEMVALCARNPTKIDTPKKKEIRDKMFVQKYEAKSKSYLQDIRKAAMIECR